MSIRLLSATAAILVLCACDQSQPAEKAQGIVVRSEIQNRMHQYNDLDRAIALKRAIYGSGLRCQRVTESGYVQEHQNLSMWMARCDDGRDWGIFLGPDGTAQVRPCKDLAELGLPACVIKPAATKPS